MSAPLTSTMMRAWPYPVPVPPPVPVPVVVVSVPLVLLESVVAKINALDVEKVKLDALIAAAKAGGA